MSVIVSDSFGKLIITPMLSGSNIPTQLAIYMMTVSTSALQAYWILRRIFLNSSLTIFYCTLDQTLHNIARLHPTKVCFPGKEIHYQGSYQRSKCHENRFSNNFLLAKVNAFKRRIVRSSYSLVLNFLRSFYSQSNSK